MTAMELADLEKNEHSAQWIEENRDALERRYYQEYQMSLHECFTGMNEAFKRFERALVQMGILEKEDEEEDDPDEY